MSHIERRNGFLTHQDAAVHSLLPAFNDPSVLDKTAPSRLASTHRAAASSHAAPHRALAIVGAILEGRHIKAVTLPSFPRDHDNHAGKTTTHAAAVRHALRGMLAAQGRLQG